MKKLTILISLALSGCTLEVSDIPSGESDGLECPGSLQCECPCEPPLFCGPHGACTKFCQNDEDCGDLSGEHCIGEDSMNRMCGVSCTPGGLNDCEATGIPKPVACRTISGTHVCGFH